MNRGVLLIAIGASILSGCVSMKAPMGYTNIAATDAKQGQDCRTLVGIGRAPDLTGAQAMRQGGITKLRNIEYREQTFNGVGQACVVAYGE